MTSFADQVHDRPVVVALLQIRDVQLDGLVPAQTAQATRIANSARSRLPFMVSGSGASSSVTAWSGRSQLPSRAPIFLTPLTRRIPAARSAVRRPQSEASYASRRTAPNRRLTVPGASSRDSRWIRYRSTTVRLKESRGSEQYHSTNSSMACRYPRWASRDVRLLGPPISPGPGLAHSVSFSGAAFAWSRGPLNHESIMTKPN